MYIEEILLEKFQELERLRNKLIYDNDEEAQATIKKIEDLELEMGLLAQPFKDKWIKEEVDLEEYASIVDKDSI